MRINTSSQTLTSHETTHTLTSATKNSIANILTIAGSDSGGGAGIQADIKAISATGSYACSVIAALTAQNTQGVSGVYQIPAEFIGLQLDAIFHDLEIAAVKIGMLNDAEAIKTIADKLKQYQVKLIVIDPVMVATSGDVLIQDTAVELLKTELFPLATVITPNLSEAAWLMGVEPPVNEDHIDSFIQQIRLNPYFQHSAILLKGGHFNGVQSTDWLVTEKGGEQFTRSRIKTNNTHGTGCTLSSAIASYLGQGYPLNQAIDKAKSYLTHALIQANHLNVGQGAGPVDHFYELRQQAHVNC